MEENKGFFKGIIILLLIIIILLLGVVIMFLVKDYKEQEKVETENKPQENVYIENGYENESTLENILVENGAGEVVENTNATENVTNENTTDLEAKLISREQAIEIAFKDLNIKREDVLELEVDKDFKYGKNVYEIDFKYDRHEYEYYISDDTGEIVYSFKERD